MFQFMILSLGLRILGFVSDLGRGLGARSEGAALGRRSFRSFRYKNNLFLPVFTCGLWTAGSNPTIDWFGGTR